jgi:uncharacterized protein (DUF433 family)
LAEGREAIDNYPIFAYNKDMNTTYTIPLVIEAQSLPISLDANGIVRVGNTRVTLDSIVTAFLEGATAEEISYQYPSVGLPDIYAVISYYLRNESEVEKYLQNQKKQAKAVRRQNEKRYNPLGIRERLLVRQASSK